MKDSVGVLSKVERGKCKRIGGFCGFFGGGDMNGIKLLVPEVAVRIIYGLVLIVNVFVFVKIVLPKYKLAFADEAQ
mgnify:CR=1 FL=1